MTTVSAMPLNNGKDLLIAVKGRFDFSSLQPFRGAYENPNVQPHSYIIDLKEAIYLDSSALSMLLALRDHAIHAGAKIKIVNCNKDVKKILVVTKLDELFDIE